MAILIQRTANCLYKLKVPILPRIMTEYAHSITGIDIYIVNIEIDTICGKPSGVYSDKRGKRKA